MPWHEFNGDKPANFVHVASPLDAQTGFGPVRTPSRGAVLPLHHRAVWSIQRESNPHVQLGRLAFYR